MIRKQTRLHRRVGTRGASALDFELSATNPQSKQSKPEMTYETNDVNTSPAMKTSATTQRGRP